MRSDRDPIFSDAAPGSLSGSARESSFVVEIALRMKAVRSVNVFKCLTVNRGAFHHTVAKLRKLPTPTSVHPYLPCFPLCRSGICVSPLMRSSVTFTLSPDSFPTSLD